MLLLIKTTIRYPVFTLLIEKDNTRDLRENYARINRIFEFRYIFLCM